MFLLDFKKVLISFLKISKAFRFLFAGLISGVGNLVTGMALGEVGSHLALADLKSPTLFFTVLTIEIFTAVISLYGLVVSILMIGVGEFE